MTGESAGSDSGVRVTVAGAATAEPRGTDSSVHQCPRGDGVPAPGERRTASRSRVVAARPDGWSGVLAAAANWSTRAGTSRPLAVLAAALGRLAAAAGRLLKELAQGTVLMEPATLMILGGTAWPDWESEQPPGHSVSQAQDRPQSDWTDLP